MEHGRERHLTLAAGSQPVEVAPSANRREAPGLEPPQRDVGPLVRIDVMLPSTVAGIGGIEFATGKPLVDTTNAQRKKPLATWADEPGGLVLLLNRERRVLVESFPFGGVSADALAQRQQNRANETRIQGSSKGYHGLLHGRPEHARTILSGQRSLWALVGTPRAPTAHFGT